MFFILCLYGYFIFVVIFYIFGGVDDGKASYIHVCKSTEANLTNCIINSVNLLRPKLQEGIPELNVPPIEPLLLDEVKLRSGPSNAKINANITNIKVWGPSSFEILEIKPNLPKAKFAFKAMIPHLYFEGDYDIDMKILVLEYKGVGPITGNFTNYSFDCILKGNKIKQNGEEYLKFDKMRLKLYIGHSRISLGNLFRNDPIIGRATHDVINDNTDLFINEIKPLLCRKSEPEFAQCLWKNLETIRPRIIKGIRELNIPRVDPFTLSETTVNQTISEVVSISAILKNVKTIGAGNAIIEDFKANPFNLTGELRCTFPWIQLEMDYDVNGQLLIVPLRSKGHFIGNFTDTRIYGKGSIKTVDRDGVQYFKVDKISLKSVVGDGQIKLTAENPELQFSADLIANFYNDNPRLVMDTVNPIYIQTAEEFYKVIFDRILADYISDLVCRKSDPEYERCVLKNVEKARPLLIKGIPELNMPAVDPFELPVMTVDRTINELVSIKAVTKNIKVLGAGNVVIEDFKANPANLTGELRLNFPWTQLEMDYDVNGQLLIVPLRTDTQLYARGSVKIVDKDGVKYYRVDKLNMKIRVGDGEVKLTADNPDLQFGADLIANFFNENPRRVMDAINPIFVETATDLYRVVLDQILASVPAKEWLPE
ncbi:circadian clock-controlled protein [Asbolus verrucosus]|uniref:Circadian clock-controlled protein n=1 Tax=Asbolus verrucosus TaxID=1661398 RepID=A0A482W2B3_ASBVE|nr:circadian clock-controlled protein [Asbolus verrucosus]